MAKQKFHIDYLIEIVSKGGTVRTGIDIFSRNDVLLLRKDFPISNVNILLNIKKNGVLEITINPQKAGGLWDQHGNQLLQKTAKQQAPKRRTRQSDLKKKIREINELRIEAAQKYKNAKQNIKKVIADIKATGGQFDYELVESTVTDIFNFLTRNDNSFSYLTKEIFSYDDYLYNHSINVCTVGTAVLRRFNDQFNDEINKNLSSFSASFSEKQAVQSAVSFIYFRPEELCDMSIGFFLHDVGKVLVPEEILNKEGSLTAQELELVRTHSFEKGVMILDKNRLDNPFIRNIVKYHHSPLFKDEENCYPDDRHHIENPPYVKIGKLADIYDAMTSKRCYKEAFNPIAVVTKIFHKYADKDFLLQFILYSFVKVIGIYPPGSVVLLCNGQMAYIIDSEGPIVIPFTDTHGTTLSVQPDPLDLGDEDVGEELSIDRRKPITSPAEIYEKLPAYLKESAQRP